MMLPFARTLYFFDHLEDQVIVGRPGVQISIQVYRIQRHQMAGELQGQVLEMLKMLKMLKMLTLMTLI